jgi:hypothetical protein
MHRTAREQTLMGRYTLPDINGLGGAVAGLLAGLVMVLVSPILSLLNGISIWEPARLIAMTAPWYGPQVLDRTGFEVGPVLTGLLLHLVTSVALGFLFGIVTHRLLHLTTEFGLPVYIGLSYGLVVFVVAYFIILPFINPALTEQYVPSLLAQNVIFGMVLGIIYTLIRPQPYRSGNETR